MTMANTKKAKLKLKLDAKKVERVIEARGLRKKWVAQQMRVAPTSLSRWLNGDRVASEAMIALLASVLGVPEKEIAAA
jgi:transcriptional regulator with XRE-family HTH domain